MGRVMNLKASTSASPATQSPRVSVGPSLSATPRLITSPPPIANAPPVPAIPVVATVGNGVSGENVWRIRPGTAVPGFTRIVFDLTEQGLPTMVVTRPDDLHLVVNFRSTGGADVPVQGIQSYHVAGVEPAVQRGPDLLITIDLARPVRPVVFTLLAEAGRSPRLVLDLYTT